MTPSDRFLEQFFGSGNAIRWSALLSPTGMEAKGRLQPFLDLYVALRSDGQGIAILPRRFSGDELRWYVLSRYPASARHAREVVNAYLGASYSDIGEGSQLSATDPIDQLIRADFGPHCFSVRTIHRKEDNELVRGRLLSMADALRTHPRSTATRPHTVGRILRSFEQALEDKDEAAVNIYLDQLRDTGHLDALNITYLELRRDGAMERWRDVLSRTDLISILDAGVPRKVAETLLRAVFETELARFEPDADGSAALQVFRSELEPRYGQLYRTRAGLDGYAVDVQFVLAAVVRGQRLDLTSVLARYAEHGPRYRFLESIVRASPTPSPTPPLQFASALNSARQAFFAGDIDGAFAAASSAPSSPERTALMLRWALEIDMPEALSEAIHTYDALQTDDQKAFCSLPRNERLLTVVRKQLGLIDAAQPPLAAMEAPPTPPSPVVDWLSWLRRLKVEEPWTAAVAAASRGESVWRIEPLEQAPERLAEATEILDSTLPPWATEALNDALPCLVRAWLGQDVSASMKPLYAALCRRLFNDSIRSLASATALVRVVSSLIELGRSPADYALLVDQTSEYLKGVTTSGVTLVALEALENLIDLPCPDTKVRREFASAVTSIHGDRHAKGDLLQFHLLQLLGSETGLSAPAIAVGSPFDPSWASFAGRHVAFYSLNAHALGRVRALLKSYCASVNVSTFETKEGGGAALREAARSADVFVIAWGCTRQAAAIYVGDYRPNSRPTLGAAGRGSGALLASVDRWIGKTTLPLPGDPSLDLQDSGHSSASPAVLAEVGALRNRLEPKLRTFIKRLLKAHLGAKWFKFVLDTLPESIREQCVGVDADEVLNQRLFLTNLVTVLQVGWDRYFKVLESGPPSESVRKASVQVLLEYVNAHREDAHAKPVSEGDLAALQIAVQALERALARHLED